MGENALKCVIVLDEQLPVGLLANTAAVLALTLSRKVEAVIGPDVLDGSGRLHVGITRLTLPILQAQADALKRIWMRAIEASEVLVVDFTEVAQTNHRYEEYAQQLSATSSDQLRYLGIALYGPRDAINKLTGSLSLLK